MIDFLSGKLLSLKAFHWVIDVNGVGYGVDVPLGHSVGISVPRIGENAKLFVHTHVQEDAIRLYGFLTDAEKQMFELLINVSGIGPRSAMMIMSEMQPSELATAIVAEDIKGLSKIKGIGRKTSERLIVELREKMIKFIRGSAVDKASLDGGDVTGENAPPPPALQSVVNDAIDALTAMDCKYAVAERAVMTALKELGPDAALNDLIKLALKYR